MIRLTVHGAEPSLDLTLNMPSLWSVGGHVVPGAEAPSGDGEPATPVTAPAVANAAFTARCQHLRSCP